MNAEILEVKQVVTDFHVRQAYIAGFDLLTEIDSGIYRAFKEAGVVATEIILFPWRMEAFIQENGSEEVWWIRSALGRKWSATVGES